MKLTDEELRRLIRCIRAQRDRIIDARDIIGFLPNRVADVENVYNQLNQEIIEYTKLQEKIASLRQNSWWTPTRGE